MNINEVEKMGKQVYLDTHNAEELLPDVIGFMKSKIAQDSRLIAFEDCTKYWKERVKTVLISNLSDDEKLEAFKKMF
jgi:hypothetical protein